ncbi:uncharacterized protein [Lepisosteus oculatus]|uniref:uncharacterized protein isoform X2 n=1 Tax=Lepisosteus oculatus TaxID=7918 RepID=UPI0037145779
MRTPGEARSAVLQKHPSGMEVCKFILLLALCFILPSASPPPLNKKPGCLKVSHCKCLLKDGSGVINLAALGGSAGLPQRYRAEPAGADEVLVSFSPCSPFSEPAEVPGTQCLEVAACVVVRHHTSSGGVESRYFNYGQHEGNEFRYDNQSRTLSVTYPVLSSSLVHTVVHYHCSPNHSVSLSQPVEHNRALEIFVRSPCACPNSCNLEDVGPMTIFLIVLCLGTAAYFILGSCALRPFRSTQGVQIRPEESLWCVLCYQFTEERGRRLGRSQCIKEETL